jgi:hypothetical protein
VLLSLPRCSSRSILYSTKESIVPRRPQAGGAGVLPAEFAFPIKVFFTMHALLEQESIVPRRPQAGGAGVLPAEFAFPTRVFFTMHALLEQESIIPHCFLGEQGGKKLVYDPHIWQPYGKTCFALPYLASSLPPKSPKIGIFQWRGGRGGPHSRSTIFLQAATPHSGLIAKHSRRERRDRRQAVFTFLFPLSFLLVPLRVLRGFSYE